MTNSPATIIVCDGDETGQELLVEALRALDPGRARRATRTRALRPVARKPARNENQIVHDAAAAMRETGLGLKAATITPPEIGSVGSPNRILREGIGGSVIVRTGRRIPGVSPSVAAGAPIIVVRMAVGDAYGADEGRQRRTRPGRKCVAH